MPVSPYLFFEGVCEDAIGFYKQAVGAEVVTLMRYGDAPPSDGPSRVPAGSESKIMHAALKIGGSDVMASDGFCHGARKFEGFSLSLETSDKVEATRMFDALSQGGEVRQPLVETFFSPAFGMLADKFGVGWIIVARQA